MKKMTDSAAAFTLSRRGFLVGTLVAGGGLVLGVPGATAGVPSHDGIGAWLHVAPDGGVRVTICQAEMGQGVITALAMLAAEELDAEWERVQTLSAPVAAVYRNDFVVKNLLSGESYGEEEGFWASGRDRAIDWIAGVVGQQVTGGSTSIRWLYMPLRRAGATLRAMLIMAAAARWNVPVSECVTEPGAVLHPTSGRRAGFGELADAAQALKPPASVTLKSNKAFRLIGRPVPRLDTPLKVAGQATFGIDVRLPDQLFAAIAHCPYIGGKLLSVDDALAKTMRGVQFVMRFDDAVAVVADNSWRARQALSALVVQWDEGPNRTLSSPQILQQMRAALADRGKVAEKAGDGVKAMTDAKRRIEAEYALPYLAHATMEPINCTALVRGEEVEVWLPTQSLENARKAAADAAGVSVSQVKMHMTYLGGGFGRRSEVDMVGVAVKLAKTAGRPVQLLWSREEDMRHDFYRPASVAKLSCGFGADGMPTAWTQRIVCPSIMARVFPPLTWSGLDGPAVEGAIKLPYAIANRQIEYVEDKTPVPVGFWRSVGHSHNAFYVESFVDEIAAAASIDPLELRRRLLRHRPRFLAVLDKIAEVTNWGKQTFAAAGHGLALHESFGSIVAVVAEVHMDRATNKLVIDRLASVIDCGAVVNPNTVEAQVQGSMIFGLSAALYGRITLKDGAVEQGNFPDYPVATLADVPPAIDVHIISSEEKPGGVGEPAVPPLAPALTNAIFALTGKRLRQLPIADQKLI